jgi:flagellar biosynthesis protein FliO
MILKIKLPRPAFPSSRRGMVAFAGGPAATGSTFHAMLTDCMDEWVVRQSPGAGAPREESAIAPRAKQRQPRAAGPNALARVWSWLHSKYAQSATKRLRVAETVSLGEKRFVALVSVEGREFLIGGGSSGVSMLTSLEDTRKAKSSLTDGLDDESDREEEDSE